MFDLNVKNNENLDRSIGPALLPRADGPRLWFGSMFGPYLSIVGHDPETFAQRSLESMGTPKSLSNKFTNPWVQLQAYCCLPADRL